VRDQFRGLLRKEVDGSREDLDRQTLEGTRGGNPSTSGESTPGGTSVQELKLPKPEEPKWIVTIRSRKTRVDRSCISGESTPRESEHEFETSEGRSPKWTRAVDLRRTCGRRSVISEKSHSGRKRSALNKNSQRPESQSSSESSVC
jgi:hypothetical protein